MAKASRLNLEAVGWRTLLAAFVCFVVGLAMGIAVWGWASRNDPDAGPFLAILLALPLALTPVSFLVGFMLQEAALSGRSRLARAGSSAACGVLIVVLLAGLLRLGRAIEPFLVIPL